MKAALFEWGKSMIKRWMPRIFLFQGDEIESLKRDGWNAITTFSHLKLNLEKINASLPSSLSVKYGVIHNAVINVNWANFSESPLRVDIESIVVIIRFVADKDDERKDRETKTSDQSLDDWEANYVKEKMLQQWEDYHLANSTEKLGFDSEFIERLQVNVKDLTVILEVEMGSKIAIVTFNMEEAVFMDKLDVFNVVQKATTAIGKKITKSVHISGLDDDDEDTKEIAFDTFDAQIDTSDLKILEREFDEDFRTGDELDTKTMTTLKEEDEEKEKESPGFFDVIQPVSNMPDRASGRSVKKSLALSGISAFLSTSSYPVTFDLETSTPFQVRARYQGFASAGYSILDDKSSNKVKFDLDFNRDIAVNKDIPWLSFSVQSECLALKFTRESWTVASSLSSLLGFAAPERPTDVEDGDLAHYVEAYKQFVQGKKTDEVVQEIKTIEKKLSYDSIIRLRNEALENVPSARTIDGYFDIWWCMISLQGEEFSVDIDMNQLHFTFKQDVAVRFEIGAMFEAISVEYFSEALGKSVAIVSHTTSPDLNVPLFGLDYKQHHQSGTIYLVNLLVTETVNVHVPKGLLEDLSGFFATPEADAATRKRQPSFFLQSFSRNNLLERARNFSAVLVTETKSLSLYVKLKGLTFNLTSNEESANDVMVRVEELECRPDILDMSNTLLVKSVPLKIKTFEIYTMSRTGEKLPIISEIHNWLIKVDVTRIEFTLTLKHTEPLQVFIRKDLASTLLVGIKSLFATNTSLKSFARNNGVNQQVMPVFRLFWNLKSVSMMFVEPQKAMSENLVLVLDGINYLITVLNDRTVSEVDIVGIRVKLSDINLLKCSPVLSTDSVDNSSEPAFLHFRKESAMEISSMDIMLGSVNITMNAKNLAYVSSVLMTYKDLFSGVATEIYTEDEIITTTEEMEYDIERDLVLNYQMNDIDLFFGEANDPVCSLQILFIKGEYHFGGGLQNSFHVVQNVTVRDYSVDQHHANHYVLKGFVSSRPLVWKVHELRQWCDGRAGNLIVFGDTKPLIGLKIRDIEDSTERRISLRVNRVAAQIVVAFLEKMRQFFDEFHKRLLTLVRNIDFSILKRGLMAFLKRFIFPDDKTISFRGFALSPRIIFPSLITDGMSLVFSPGNVLATEDLIELSALNLRIGSDRFTYRVIGAIDHLSLSLEDAVGRVQIPEVYLAASKLDYEFFFEIMEGNIFQIFEVDADVLSQFKTTLLDISSTLPKIYVRMTDIAASFRKTKLFIDLKSYDDVKVNLEVLTNIEYKQDESWILSFALGVLFRDSLVQVGMEEFSVAQHAKEIEEKDEDERQTSFLIAPTAFDFVLEQNLESDVFPDVKAFKIDIRLSELDVLLNLESISALQSYVFMMAKFLSSFRNLFNSRTLLQFGDIAADDKELLDLASKAERALKEKKTLDSTERRALVSVPKDFTTTLAVEGIRFEYRVHGMNAVRAHLKPNFVSGHCLGEEYMIEGEFATGMYFFNMVSRKWENVFEDTVVEIAYNHSFSDRLLSSASVNFVTPVTVDVSNQIAETLSTAVVGESLMAITVTNFTERSVTFVESLGAKPDLSMAPYSRRQWSSSSARFIALDGGWSTLQPVDFRREGTRVLKLISKAKRGEILELHVTLRFAGEHLELELHSGCCVYNNTHADIFLPTASPNAVVEKDKGKFWLPLSFCAAAQKNLILQPALEYAYESERVVVDFESSSPFYYFCKSTSEEEPSSWFCRCQMTDKAGMKALILSPVARVTNYLPSALTIKVSNKSEEKIVTLESFQSAEDVYEMKPDEFIFIAVMMKDDWSKSVRIDDSGVARVNIASYSFILDFNRGNIGIYADYWIRSLLDQTVLAKVEKLKLAVAKDELVVFSEPDAHIEAHRLISFTLEAEDKKKWEWSAPYSLDAVDDSDGINIESSDGKAVAKLNIHIEALNQYTKLLTLSPRMIVVNEFAGYEIQFEQYHNSALILSLKSGCYNANDFLFVPRAEDANNLYRLRIRGENEQIYSQWSVPVEIDSPCSVPLSFKSAKNEESRYALMTVAVTNYNLVLKLAALPKTLVPVSIQNDSLFDEVFFRQVNTLDYRSLKAGQSLKYVWDNYRSKKTLQLRVGEFMVDIETEKLQVSNEYQKLNAFRLADNLVIYLYVLQPKNGDLRFFITECDPKLERFFFHSQDHINAHKQLYVRRIAELTEQISENSLQLKEKTKYFLAKFSEIQEVDPAKKTQTLFCSCTFGQQSKKSKSFSYAGGTVYINDFVLFECSEAETVEDVVFKVVLVNKMRKNSLYEEFRIPVKELPESGLVNRWFKVQNSRIHVKCGFTDLIRETNSRLEKFDRVNFLIRQIGLREKLLLNYPELQTLEVASDPVLVPREYVLSIGRLEWTGELDDKMKELVLQVAVHCGSEATTTTREFVRSGESSEFRLSSASSIRFFHDDVMSGAIKFRLLNPKDKFAEIASFGIPLANVGGIPISFSHGELSLSLLTLDLTNEKKRFDLEVAIPDLAFSLIRQLDSGSLEEFALFGFSGTQFALKRYGTFSRVDFQIKSFQFDNQSVACQYPVVFAGFETASPALLVSASLVDSKDNLVRLDSASIMCQELCLNIERGLVTDLTAYFRSIYLRRKAKPIAHLPDLSFEMLVDTAMKMGHSKQFYFGSLQIHPFVITLNYFPEEKVSKHLPVTVQAVQRLVSQFGEIEESRISVSGIEIKDVVANEHTLVNPLVMFYKKQLTNQIFEVIGSLKIVGTPVKIVHGLGSGIVSFIQEPVKGIIAGPKEIPKGIARGTSTLVDETVKASRNLLTCVSRVYGRKPHRVSLARALTRYRPRRVIYENEVLPYASSQVQMMATLEEMEALFASRHLDKEVVLDFRHVESQEGSETISIILTNQRFVFCFRVDGVIVTNKSLLCRYQDIVEFLNNSRSFVISAIVNSEIQCCAVSTAFDLESLDGIRAKITDFRDARKLITVSEEDQLWLTQFDEGGAISAYDAVQESVVDTVTLNNGSMFLIVTNFRVGILNESTAFWQLLEDCKAVSCVDACIGFGNRQFRCANSGEASLADRVLRDHLVRFASESVRLWIQKSVGVWRIAQAEKFIGTKVPADRYLFTFKRGGNALHRIFNPGEIVHL